MKAIFTKYHGPGNCKGSSVIAWDSDENRVKLGWDDALSADQNHDAAVIALCKKMNWTGHLVNGGGLKNGRVYVWLDSELVSCARLWVSEDDSLVPYNGHPFASWGVLTVGKAFDEILK